MDRLANIQEPLDRRHGLGNYTSLRHCSKFEVWSRSTSLSSHFVLRPSPTTTQSSAQVLSHTNSAVCRFHKSISVQANWLSKHPSRATTSRASIHLSPRATPDLNGLVDTRIPLLWSLTICHSARSHASFGSVRECHSSRGRPLNVLRPGI